MEAAFQKNFRRILKSYRTKVRRHVQPGSSFGTFTALGCTPETFKTHIEKHFKGEMSWENYGKTWVLMNQHNPEDYDLLDLDQFLAYFHYSSYLPVLNSEFNWSKTEGIPVVKKG